jgi:hypothetical protein
MAVPPKEITLPEAYARIYHWYKSDPTTADVPAHSQQLVARMPPPEQATASEMVYVLHQVSAGALEYRFGGQNGDRTNGEIARAGIAAAAGGPLSAREREAIEAAFLRRTEGSAPSDERSSSQQHAPNEASGSSVDRDLVPLEALSEFETYDSIPYLMGRAADLAAGATPAIPVSPSLLFFALTDSIDTEGRWTAHVIREFIDQHSSSYVVIRDGFFESKGADGIRQRPSKTKRKLSAHAMKRSLHAVLESAQDIARRTTGNRRIHARHLAAALLQNTPGNSGVFLHLNELQVDPITLRGALFDYVCGQGDNDTAWAECLLEVPPASRRLGGFATDRADGIDLLAIEPDVHALSALIAARTVDPPLSIGLFGEWGSGKTFFMRALRVKIGEIAQEMKDEKRMQRELPFYKNIVQIEFNAWHYVEGNLWASLVEHILDNLYANDDASVTLRLQEGLIKRLATEAALAQASSTEVESAKVAAEAAKTELDAAQNELTKKTEELANLNAAQVARDFVLTKAHQPVVDALNQLGFAKVGETAVELEGALRHIHVVLGRGQRLLAPLTRAQDRGRRFLWLLLSLIGAPVTAIVVRVTMRWLEMDGASIYAALTGFATLIASIVPWLKSQADWMSKRLDEAEAAQKAFDQEMAKQSAEQINKVTQAEQKLRELTAALDAALRKLSEAKGREATATAELKAATTGRLLANFIADRAASGDYRRHLGVLALVRDDFEKLSGLIADENWQLSPDDPDEKKRPKGLAKFATLAEEEQDEAKRINRIVLYIDDLDRCPPNKVVEVLQAVHLLLAFPLFVVVVGVDARWITRSLETKYRELLLVGNRSVEKEEEAGLMAGSATPNDYLEKIFQIPFWLKPMDATASDRMVRGVLRPGAAPPPPAASVVPGAPPPAQTVVGGAPSQGSTPAVTPNTPPSLGTLPPNPSSMPPHPPAGGLVRGQAAKLGLESLAITDAELDYITKLAPVLGRSPRALKRFANVYRLIKVGLESHEQRAFLLERSPLSNYQAVLFLLAVDSGTPMIARQFFATIDLHAGRTIDETPMLTNLNFLVSQFDEVSTREDQVGWQRLRSWLTSDANTAVPLTTELSVLSAWSRRVGRYSFEVGRS